MRELPTKVYNLLSKKYNIIDVISFLDFDHDFDYLKSRLSALKKDHYDTYDRIIIEHLDTDYYFEHCTVGINLLNMFNVITDIDIPKFVFLLYTNHFGIQKEINEICKDINNQPTVIESFISDLHYSSNDYINYNWDLSSISHNALCMMNIKRSHRSAVYNSIKDISETTLMLSIHVNSNAT